MLLKLFIENIVYSNIHFRNLNNIFSVKSESLKVSYIGSNYFMRVSAFILSTKSSTIDLKYTSSYIRFTYYFIIFDSSKSYVIIKY